LLACRFIMGIGGALMWPAILGMTFSLLPKSKAGLAGGLIMGSAGFGNAFGPLLGGALTDTIGWRWVFFLNLPIAVAAVVITYLVVKPDGERTDHEGIDYLGMGVLTIGLFSLLLALDLGTRIGTLLMSAIFFAALLYLPQFMEKVLKFSAVESGAGLLPMMGTFAVTSFVAGRLYARLGPKVSVTGGALGHGCARQA